MSTDTVEQELVRIVREELLLGSERELPLDAPLGELGLGLDSLALVNLLTRIENAFGVELPEDVWTARGPLSLADLAELTAARPAAPAATGPRPPALLQGRMERAEHTLSRYGVLGRAAWAALRVAVPVRRFLFTREGHVLLERSLDGEYLEPPTGLVLRRFEAGDEERLVGLWAPFNERSGRRGLDEALRAGAAALVAVEDGHVVGIDLYSGEGDREARPGQADACLGFFLAEAPAVRGRGVGLALIAYSFEQASADGFRTQLTYVREDNTAMLAAATQLLGFRPIGTARRTHVFGLSRWSWELGGRRGSGPKLVL